MKILIVTNHFHPENFRINDLAVGLQERGHDITVYTGVPDYPEGKFWEGYGIFRRRREIWKGIKVVRFPLIPRGKGRGIELVLNYLSSAVFSSLLAPLCCRDRYDLIFVFETSPILIGLPAILLKKIKKIPVFLWVLDLWPESLSATGAVRSPLLISQIRKLVRYIYKNCDRLLISSKGFEKSIQNTGGYEGHIEYFPNWVEPEYFAKPEHTPEKLPKLPKGFRILFAGNIGAAQDFTTILKSAEQLKGYGDIQWVILGDGRQAAWVRDQVQERGLENCFHLLGKHPSENMPVFFEQADALLVTLRKDPIFSLTVPGKVQSYMASGRPILAGMDGEGAQIVEESGAGLTCPAESPDELANQVLALYSMSTEERHAMGERGKRYSHASFDRNKLFAKLEEQMAELISEKKKAFAEGGKMKLLDSQTLDSLSEEAKRNTRLRKNLNLHSDYSEPSQRLLNAMEPGSYIRPHRHLRDPKPECFIGIRGKLGLILFDDDGGVEKVFYFGPTEENAGADIPPGVWHTVVCLDKGSVFFETKPGPFIPIYKKDMAPWAPEEGGGEAQAFLEDLVRMIESWPYGNKKLATTNKGVL